MGTTPFCPFGALECVKLGNGWYLSYRWPLPTFFRYKPVIIVHDSIPRFVTSQCVCVYKYKYKTHLLCHCSISITCSFSVANNISRRDIDSNNPRRLFVINQRPFGWSSDEGAVRRVRGRGGLRLLLRRRGRAVRRVRSPRPPRQQARREAPPLLPPPPLFFLFLRRRTEAAALRHLPGITS